MPHLEPGYSKMVHRPAVLDSTHCPYVYRELRVGRVDLGVTILHGIIGVRNCHMARGQGREFEKKRKEGLRKP